MSCRVLQFQFVAQVATQPTAKVSLELHHQVMGPVFYLTVQNTQVTGPKEHLLTKEQNIICLHIM